MALKTDILLTKVIFRVDTTEDFKGTVFALFPFDEVMFQDSVTVYHHVGQHSSGNYAHCIETSKPAKEGDYQDLKKELEGLGYNLKVVSKRSFKQKSKNNI